MEYIVNILERCDIDIILESHFICPHITLYVLNRKLREIEIYDFQDKDNGMLEQLYCRFGKPSDCKQINRDFGLFYACAEGNESLIDYFYNLGGNPLDGFFGACVGGQVEAFYKMIKYGAVNMFNSPSLSFIDPLPPKVQLEDQDISIISYKVLMNRGRYYASKYKRYHLMDHFSRLVNGLPFHDCYTVACDNNDMKMIKKLDGPIKRNASIYRYPVLEYACINGLSEIAEQLYEYYHSISDFCRKDLIVRCISSKKSVPETLDMLTKNRHNNGIFEYLALATGKRVNEICTPNPQILNWLHKRQRDGTIPEYITVALSEQ